MMKHSTVLFAALLIPMIMFSQLKFTLDASILKKGEGFYVDNEDVKHEGNITLRMTTFTSDGKFKAARIAIKDAEGAKSKFYIRANKTSSNRARHFYCST